MTHLSSLESKFLLLEAPSGHLLSYSAWTGGAWLPATDAVTFLRIGKETPAMVEREKAMDLAGDLIEAVEIYPPRFRAKGFPTEEQLEAMGSML